MNPQDGSGGSSRRGSGVKKSSRNRHGGGGERGGQQSNYDRPPRGETGGSAGFGSRDGRDGGRSFYGRSEHKPVRNNDHGNYPSRYQNRYDEENIGQPVHRPREDRYRQTTPHNPEANFEKDHRLNDILVVDSDHHSFKGQFSIDVQQSRETFDSPVRRCYNCQEPDHFSRDCPQPKQEHQEILAKKCFNCSKFGHMKKDCPEQKQEEGFYGNERYLSERPRGDRKLTNSLPVQYGCSQPYSDQFLQEQQNLSSLRYVPPPPFKGGMKQTSMDIRYAPSNCVGFTSSSDLPIPNSSQQNSDEVSPLNSANSDEQNLNRASSDERSLPQHPNFQLFPTQFNNAVTSSVSATMVPSVPPFHPHLNINAAPFMQNQPAHTLLLQGNSAHYIHPHSYKDGEMTNRGTDAFETILGSMDLQPNQSIIAPRSCPMPSTQYNHHAKNTASQSLARQTCDTTLANQTNLNMPPPPAAYSKPVALQQSDQNNGEWSSAKSIYLQAPGSFAGLPPPSLAKNDHSVDTINAQNLNPNLSSNYVPTSTDAATLQFNLLKLSESLETRHSRESMTTTRTINETLAALNMGQAESVPTKSAEVCPNVSQTELSVVAEPEPVVLPQDPEPEPGVVLKPNVQLIKVAAPDKKEKLKQLLNADPDNWSPTGEFCYKKKTVIFADSRMMADHLASFLRNNMLSSISAHVLDMDFGDRLGLFVKGWHCALVSTPYNFEEELFFQATTRSHMDHLIWFDVPRRPALFPGMFEMVGPNKITILIDSDTDRARATDLLKFLKDGNYDVPSWFKEFAHSRPPPVVDPASLNWD